MTENEKKLIYSTMTKKQIEAAINEAYNRIREQNLKVEYALNELEKRR